MVNSEGHNIRHVSEESVYGCMTLEYAHLPPVPSAVFGEKLGEFVGWIASIAKVAVTGF